MPKATRIPQQATVTPEMLDRIRAHVVPFAGACFTDDRGKPAIAYPHHALMAFVLMRDWLGNTVIVAPPEHAKTMWVGNWYTAWCIGRDPSVRIGYISASEGHALKQSKNVRAILDANPNYRALFPSVNPDVARGWSEKQWFVQRPGDDPNPTFLAIGIGSRFMGARIDRAIFDDVNDQKQQASPTQRQDTLDWCVMSAMSRLPEHARAINVQTRWSEEDWASWCIRDGWAYLHFRAMAEDDGKEQYGVLTIATEQIAERVRADLAAEGWQFTVRVEPVQRHERVEQAWVFRVLLHTNGPALWPERRSAESLRKKRDGGAMSSIQWSCMYQGEAAPEEGNVIPVSKFRRYPAAVPPADVWLKKIQSWDTAFSERTSADYTVGQTWGLARDGTMWLLDQVRKRLSFYDLKNEVAKAYNRHHPDIVLVEDNGSGQSLIQEMHRSQDITLGRVPIIGIRALRDKRTRTEAVTGYIEAERVYIPEGVEWVTAFVRECALFPNDAHDDQVDAMVLALGRMIQLNTDSSWDDDEVERGTLVGNQWDKQW